MHMSHDIAAFATTCDLLAFGEPTHQEPAFGHVRNELFARLAEHGFRSIAIESDRVAGLAVDAYVRDGVGTLDAVMKDGFSHTFGELAPNRDLVAWMREYNETRPPEQQLAFHGFDASTETMSAPSPRTYLEHARDYLGLDQDFATLLGDDERWSRTEAVWYASESIGDTPEAHHVRAMADDMLVELYARAATLIAATSRAAWFTAKTHLTAGLGLLAYHRQASRPLDQNARVSLLMGVRDGLMARNLLDIRDVEQRRGPLFVFAHNQHLRRTQGAWQLGDMALTWSPAGATVASLLAEKYVFVAGSIGRSEALGLADPEPGTYEALLQHDKGWRLTPSDAVPAATRTRTGAAPEKGYFPLDAADVAGADAVLHLGSP
jgi:erythromycin esterase-like protein